MTKVKSKKEVTEEHEKREGLFTLLNGWTLCHLKTSELDPKFQKIQRLWVLCGDVVKDNSASYAVFMEQESSASQITAQKFWT